MKKFFYKFSQKEIFLFIFYIIYNTKKIKKKKYIF